MSDGRRQATRPDPLTPEQRHRTMSKIRGTDTRPEMVIRRALHALGFRYRLHDRSLAGKPDLVFPSLKVVIFVHGCFWHAHDCPLGVRPGSNTDFWDTKLERNRVRDRAVADTLLAQGWRVATVWECALRGRNRRPLTEVMDDLQTFLRSSQGRQAIVVRGVEPSSSPVEASEPILRPSLMEEDPSRVSDQDDGAFDPGSLAPK